MSNHFCGPLTSVGKSQVGRDYRTWLLCGIDRSQKLSHPCHPSSLTSPSPASACPSSSASRRAQARPFRVHPHHARGHNVIHGHGHDWREDRRNLLRDDARRATHVHVLIRLNAGSLALAKSDYHNLRKVADQRHPIELVLDFQEDK